MFTAILTDGCQLLDFTSCLLNQFAIGDYLAQMASTSQSWVDFVWDGWYDLRNYCGRLGRGQWIGMFMISFVIGLLCMRGQSLKA
ncbi:MAG: hypothetical protein AAF745_04080 [Planctomycetota bacterium]